MNEKRAGILLSYALIVIEAVSGILVTVILLGGLGQSEYGLYKLALSWMSMISVLDFGLGGTITRYVVKYKTEQDRRGEENFLAMAFTVYAFLSLLVLVVGGVLCFVLPLFSKSLSADQIPEFRIVFMLLVAKTCLVLFNHAFSGRFIAYERFIYTKSVTIAYTIVRIILVWALLSFIPSAVTVVSVDFLLTAAHLLINVMASRKFGFGRAHLYSWDKKLFKEVFLFTSSVFLASVINQFNSNVDSVVLGVFSTTVIVGLYSSVIQIYTVYGMLSSAIQEVFLPQVSKSVFQKKSDDEITRTLVAPSRMQMIVLFLALTGFVLFGYDFLRIWVGNSYDSQQLMQAYVVGCILMISATWQLFQNSASNVLKAKNLLRGKVMITAASTVLNFLITVLLVPRYGMIGAAIGTAVSMVLGYGLATNIYYHVVVKLNLKLYYTETFAKLWYTVPCCFILGWAIKSINGTGIIVFLVKVFCYIVLYAILIVLFGLNHQEKAEIKARFLRTRG